MGFHNISLYISVKVLFFFNFLFFNVDKTLNISSKSSPSYILCTSTHMENILTSAYFNRFIKSIFFRCILESSCLRLFTQNPHEKQVNSYSYGSTVFRLQCPQRLAYFSNLSSSVNSIH